MKVSEFRNLIREEVKKVLSEAKTVSLTPKQEKDWLDAVTRRFKAIDRYDYAEAKDDLIYAVPYVLYNIVLGNKATDERMDDGELEKKLKSQGYDVKAIKALATKKYKEIKDEF